ncbi:MAG: hypothetical protein KAR79_01385, partial [Simkaniaceae bacterium]|nr:hypothetical protein [Simkaniaceae bacterium]
LTELPAEIGKLTALKELDLSSNQLIKIPAEIGELTSLYSLNLMSNQLTGLPVEIKSLTKLNHLLLSGNPLKSLHSSLVLRSSILGFATETTSEKWALNVMKYNKLSVEKQKNVHEWIWYEAGKPPGDDDYGQRHLFDDLEKFHKAMQAQATCNLL